MPLRATGGRVPPGPPAGPVGRTPFPGPAGSEPIRGPRSCRLGRSHETGDGTAPRVERGADPKAPRRPASAPGTGAPARRHTDRSRGRPCPEATLSLVRPGEPVPSRLMLSLIGCAGRDGGRGQRSRIRSTPAGRRSAKLTGFCRVLQLPRVKGQFEAIASPAREPGPRVILRSVSGPTPSLGPSAWATAQADPYSSSRPRAIRVARSRCSTGYLFAVIHIPRTKEAA